MKKEPALLGVIAIITSIILYIKTKLTGLTILLVVLGIALIIFGKEEDTIEQRKDIKTKKTKK